MYQLMNLLQKCMIYHKQEINMSNLSWIPKIAEVGVKVRTSGASWMKAMI